MTIAAQDFITTKLERTFEALDGNNDGYVDGSDYQKLADRLLEAYKLGKDDRRARALHAFVQTYWLELLRHIGAQENRLTKDQFVTAQYLASVDTSRLNMVEGSGHVIFDVIDVDGDNEISKAEFTRFLKDVWRSDSPEAMSMFSKLDTDGDGVISRQEFIRAQREHYLSGNPDAPGSLFFGHV
ncbi:EF-hand domain-containing protein [Streptomyces sp. NRRL S-118]|uniref:EF-hand domain-containing protein n=1 Tax=Streptomyces sp. NRRL S-118 TaxID=1463881 RepID=UPI0004C8C59D|nr:EF-hand domain-containing protein [Streptomyces sp. NRRL S-118]